MKGPKIFSTHWSAYSRDPNLWKPLHELQSPGWKEKMLLHHSRLWNVGVFRFRWFWVQG